MENKKEVTYGKKEKGSEEKEEIRGSNSPQRALFNKQLIKIILGANKNPRPVKETGILIFKILLRRGACIHNSFFNKQLGICFRPRN